MKVAGYRAALCPLGTDHYVRQCL